MIKRSKRIIFSLITILLCWTFLEILCYFFLKVAVLETRHSRDWPEGYKNSGLYKDVDLDIFYDEQRTIWSNTTFDFYRAYKPMANFKGKYISTNKEGFRKTVQYPKNKKLKKKVVVFFGGSTMWGNGVAGDYATIPSLFSKYINEKDSTINYEVRNYGVGGYHNTQEMIILLEKIGREQIDFVVFYDWCNEAIMGYEELLDGNNNLAFLQPCVKVACRAMKKFLSDKGIEPYEIDRDGWIIRMNLKSILKKSNVVRFVLRLRDAIKHKTREANERKEKVEDLIQLADQELKQVKRIVRLYRKNKRIIESLSKTFQFIPFFIMQPSVYTKEKLSDYERASPYWNDMKSVKFQLKVYELARKEFSNDGNFYDISNCIETKEIIYLDDYHTSIKGNELIVKAILDKIAPEIISKK